MGMFINKFIYIVSVLVITSFFVGWLIPKHNYSVFGFGEGAIMLDTKTGDAWVLETQNRTPSTSTPHPLSCEEDFCSPKGIHYYWVPTAVRSCYGNALSVGRNPEEAKSADEYALTSWEQKLKRYTQSND